MKGKRVSLSRWLILAGVLCLPTSALTALPPGRQTSLQRALAVIEFDHANMCPATASQEKIEATIARLADEISVGLVSGRSGPVAVKALNREVFTRLGMRASGDLNDPCNLFPSSVLERKQGYCVGIAALYLLLAERLDLPVYAVATPAHVFLRFDDGTTRINIETLQGGANVPDEQYVREQKIPEESIRRGVFMRNLTTAEFLGQMHNNLGVVYSERKYYDAAAREYETALDLDARLPAALYNWGNDLLRQGEYSKAIRRFSKALRLYPTDVWALNNRGLANLNMGKTLKARKDFERALNLDPAFAQARKNLQSIQ